jgi:hypothetical protein
MFSDLFKKSYMYVFNQLYKFFFRTSVFLKKKKHEGFLSQASSFIKFVLCAHVNRKKMSQILSVNLFIIIPSGKCDISESLFFISQKFPMSILSNEVNTHMCGFDNLIVPLYCLLIPGHKLQNK